MTTASEYPRGSEWREWDLHIHTPASFHWLGEKFGDDEKRNVVLVDEMIAAINSATPAVFALQDYWNFDGWFKLKARLKQKDAPVLKKRVFPGIELRLAAPMEGRLNAHVIFSDETKDQYLKDFLSGLSLELINQPLSRNAIIEYARNCGADKLKKHGFKKADVTADEAAALAAGLITAEINCDSYKSAIRKVPNDLAVGFMPFSTNDGLDQIKWDDHYAYALGLFQSSPIFETRNSDTWAAFVGLETDGNKKWFSGFQAALKHVPRLAVSGSDAHQFVGTPGDNDKRGYGDFPSNRKTWIKADPTWNGLQQTIKEPAKRSFIGDLPPKIEKVRQNKTFYIDTVRIAKVAGSVLEDPWLDGCDVPLNHDLVAIIGNKGSGKSAIADIIALLGQSQQKEHFSFLRRDRFRGKNGEPSRQFEGTLIWHAGEPSKMLLSDDTSPEKVELVRYIPQGRFENLCNEHVSGRSNAFERELRQVIFSHVPSNVRLGALDFDQLIEQQEEGFRATLNELRKTLHNVNSQIVSIEDQLHPTVATNLQEQIRLKTKQLEEHTALAPAEVSAPTGQLTDEQAKAAERLGVIEADIQKLDVEQQSNNTLRETLARERRAVQNTDGRLNLLQGQYNDFEAQAAVDLLLLGFTPQEVVTFEIRRGQLTEKNGDIALRDATALATISENTKNKNVLLEEKVTLNKVLNEPQQQYQKYLADKSAWQIALAAIEGNPTEPESKKGLEARVAQIQSLPALLVGKKLERSNFTKKLYDVLSSQRAARAELFQPVQNLIQSNALIRESYKLQFQANLQGSPEVIASNLFGLVKQQIGELRGEDESIAAIRNRFEKYQYKNEADADAFASDLEMLLVEASQKAVPNVAGIRAILRKDKDSVDVYDLIYGLSYLEPKYTLLFQDTEIQQLSPGQRGALLLIFYLLVDKGRNPIVLDQPEENLDNETVVSLLVPVLNEAKKSRQIIMVTHSPNLAVVCDAEQIIRATLDRKTGLKIAYNSGSIEDGIINRAVVDVLEGTKAAFNNRGQKYH